MEGKNHNHYFLTGKQLANYATGFLKHVKLTKKTKLICKQNGWIQLEKENWQQLGGCQETDMSRGGCLEQ